MNTLFTTADKLCKSNISDFFNKHEIRIYKKLENITDIKLLTDELFQELVVDALINFIELTGEIKTSKRVEYFQENILFFKTGYRLNPNQNLGQEYLPRTVVTISFGFNGDESLLNYLPNNFIVYENNINFDVIFLDNSINSKHETVIKEIEKNKQIIEEYVRETNKKIEEFNSKAPEKIYHLFQDKCYRVKKEDAILDKIFNK